MNSVRIFYPYFYKLPAAYMHVWEENIAGVVNGKELIWNMCSPSSLVKLHKVMLIKYLLKIQELRIVLSSKQNEYLYRRIMTHYSDGISDELFQQKSSENHRCVHGIWWYKMLNCEYVLCFWYCVSFLVYYTSYETLAGVY